LNYPWRDFTFDRNFESKMIVSDGIASYPRSLVANDLDRFADRPPENLGAANGNGFRSTMDLKMPDITLLAVTLRDYVIDNRRVSPGGAGGTRSRGR
jgi:hypothetical protein